MITNTLNKYAEVNSLLSTTQAGFRRQKYTIYQLQNVIIAFEDAKLFGNIYALIVDLTSAFNTTDHDKMLMIMYDLGFPTDAIEIVNNLYEEATTQVKHPSGHSTNPIPTERGTIHGDTLSPFLFLLYIVPLLRWLHVGGRGHAHSCIQNQSMADTHLHNNISSAAFADDLLCPTGNLKNLKIQALKLTPNSDWASLIVSGSKTRVTGSLNAHANKNSQGQNPEDTLMHELKDIILVQGQKSQLLPFSLES